MIQPAQSPFVLLNFPTIDGDARTLLFTDPVEIVQAHSIDEVRPALRAIQEATERGLHAAGFLAYEAAPAFDSAYLVRAGGNAPLLWFGLFRERHDISMGDLPEGAYYELSSWEPQTSRECYDHDIAAIRAAIARGESYQVNYTLRLRATFTGDDFAFFRHLCEAQQPAYCAYLNLGRYRVLSASPELFFHWNGEQITTRPMKGTAPRGRWAEEDAARAAWLAASEKNRAENLMIVDLLRNDLGRIAELGSVRVPRLFDIERYPTVWQMTSTVTAQSRPGLSVEELFGALFPCGSITGASKVSTMRLIAALEELLRGVYCGSIGFIDPDGESLFNVAIRTVWLDTESGVAEYGVGGGITWDSTAEDEYSEALVKAALLGEKRPAFELLETLLLEAGHYPRLQRHLDRLAASARYFNIPVDLDAIQKLLLAQGALHPIGNHRVRLLLSRQGAARVESTPLPPELPTVRHVGLARSPVSRENRFLYHKTTHRALYDAHRAAQPEYFDVLLWNEQGEVTEFTIGNVVLELDSKRWTPPISSGLLAGTFRAELLERGEIKERVLTRADVERASALWLINSVRGWVPVQLMKR